MNNQNKKKSLNTNYFINAAIAVCIMIFFRFIPPFGQMTVLGMTILGIFLGTLWAWIKCDMVWPSVLAIVFLGYTEYSGSVGALVSAAFSNPIIQLILWLLVFAAILTVSGISEQIANRLISSKITKGRPWVLSIIIIAACYIASVFGATFAATLICWEFVYKICKEVGYTRKDKWPRMMVIGIAFTGSVALVVLPLNVGVVSSYGYLATASEGLFSGYDYLQYLIFSLVFGFAVVAVYLLMVRLIVRPDMSKLKNVKTSANNIEPLNMKHKIAIGALIALLVVTILPSMMPDSIKAFMNTFGTYAIVLAICAFITIFRDKDGKPYYTFQELANKGLFWNLAFMVITAVTLGSALANPVSGFNDTLVTWLMPVFSGLSPYTFSLIVCAVTLIMTNVINNAVACAIMVPLMYSFSVSVGANPILLTALIVFCSDIGLLLPCSSPKGALVAANKEWVTTKDIFYHGSIALLSMLIAIALVGIPFGNMIFTY